MEFSNIEWTHHTFNHVIGCSKKSPGCKNCYAEYDMGTRRGRVVWGVNGTRSVTSYSYWRQPLKWDKEAKAAGERRRVFCASLADVFEDWGGQVIDSKGCPVWWKEGMYGDALCDVDGIPPLNTFTEDFIAKNYQAEEISDFIPLTFDIIRKYLFRLIEKTPNLDWLLLTKRIENAILMVPENWQSKFPDNVWIGTTVENQAMCDERVPIIATLPAKVKFISMEPMLEPIKIMKEYPTGKGLANFGALLSMIIVGGESGHHRRPFEAEWARSIRDQCAEYEVPFFMKQMDKLQPIPEDLMIRQFPVVEKNTDDLKNSP